MSLHQSSEHNIVGAELVEALFDAHIDAIIIAEAETGLFIAANKQAEKLTGIPLSELVGMHQSQLHPPELAEHYRQKYLEFMHQDRLIQDDIIIRHRNGHDIPVSISGSLVTIGGKKYVQGIFHDISGRKRNEQALRNHIEFQHTLIASAGEGICLWRKTETFPYTEFSIWNRRAEEITGYTLEEINTHGWYQSVYIDPEQQERAHQRMLNILAGGSLRGAEIEITTKSGQLRTLRISSNLISGSDEQQWVLAILDDVSEQKKLEAELRQMQKIEALGTLVGGIAHDFNNLLSGILGCIYLARTEVTELPEVATDLEMAEQLGLRAADLVAQLLTFARKGHVNKQPLELNAFLRQVVASRLLAIPENITLQREYCDTPLLILGDTTQMQQITMNLLGNARDALQGCCNPEITIRLQPFIPDRHFMQTHQELRAEAFAKLSVEDNGCGIEASHIERIFDPFFTTKEVGKGTGLGLSTLYSIVHGHGGTVEVESISGHGSRFHVYLPLIDHHPLEMPQTQFRPHSTPRGNGELILLVDDEESVCHATGNVLKRLGYRIITATDSEQALTLFRSRAGEVALIILDVVMPGISGPETAHRIQQLKPNVPILFATGYDIRNTLPVIGRVNVGNALSKPFRIDVLAKKISEMLIQS
ncbi:PAS domain S-box protein [Mariprofundus erugo]|uniref:hybrid sensor histidine kinase/response regulator n=1 Tax=Mariprofundus erugo TaxID=2528639 RepID=UPI0010FEAFAE|nr:PAS domain S-box protein [Mariprofundus erugo]TLS77085.1 PAS domain S-box protein [Mariprofundus erugo]